MTLKYFCKSESKEKRITDRNRNGLHSYRYLTSFLPQEFYYKVNGSRSFLHTSSRWCYIIWKGILFETLQFISVLFP